MSTARVAVAAAATLLFLPATRYGFVQDDRAIIAANPAAHSPVAALRAFDQPYWPAPAQGGLYRPLTILSYAVDWELSGGRAGWLHLMNAVWHGLATLLVMLVLARWLPDSAVLAAGLVFAFHPVHVEAVAGLVGRADLLVAVALLGAVLAARRHRWTMACVLAAAAMLSKEHGVVVGVAILLDDWLQAGGGRLGYSRGFYAALCVLTVAFLGAWWHIGGAGAYDVAAPFLGASTGGRLAIALPALWRAALLLIWPLDLSADYSPQVLPVHTGLSVAAIAGIVVVTGVLGLAWWCRRRSPAVTFAGVSAALALVPTSNLLLPSGVILAERTLYLPVLLVATGVGLGIAALRARGRALAALILAALVVCALGARTLDRLPAWRDNRTFLLTLLEEHPESYRAHVSAAAVYAGLGDAPASQREYATAESLFSGDPHLDAGYALFLFGRGDTAAAAPLVARAQARMPDDRVVLRCRFLTALVHRDLIAARALADTGGRLFPAEQGWYRPQLQ
jgi:protein O-mannosyl-transferase